MPDSPRTTPFATPRHLLLGSALASVLVASLVTTSPAVATPAPSSAPQSAANGASFETVPARRSEKVVDAYGIGIHTAYWDSPYGDTSRVAAALEDLGVEHVRDDLWNNLPRSYEAMNTIARTAGVKYDLILGNPSRGQAPAQYVATVAAHLRDSVEMIEGPNEWDNFGPSSWAAQLRTYQSELYAAAKAEPATADLPLLAPALAFRDAYAELGTQTGVSDMGNSHLYPGGRNPSVDIPAAQDMSESRTGTTRTVVTEAGYHNAINTTSGHNPVSEDVSATYLPRLLAEHALAGTQRVYTYELLDGGSDPSRTDIEAGFGLLRSDFSPKPAYGAMKNLLAVLDDTDAPFTPGALTYRTTGGGAELRQLLTQRSDGTFVLLMWRDVSVWSTASRSPIDVATTPVTVSLPTESRIAVNEPTVSATPTTLGTGTSVTVPLGGRLVALEISDDVAGVPELPAPAPAEPSEPGGGAGAIALVKQVLASPLRLGALVSWKLAGRDPRLSRTMPRTMPRTWSIRVFRDHTLVRTITRPGTTSSLRVAQLSPRHRYRFEVVARSSSGPTSQPATSRYVKPHRR